ncbi:MAG: DEAD/DEAH box helicase family protein [Candidatus Omnitrophica bacterium]|nr:DEAD/DEAH box helicase family protein [Candidatus Omnitrophota bacterium]
MNNKMLKLKFDPKLDFQVDAISSVVDIFKGQTKRPLDYTFQIIPNILDLPKEKILENLQEIQKRNGIELSKIEDLSEPYNFTIEMETGTGKTYVYLRTILELNQKYGFTKFIIVVPSVAIKEGVLKTLDITKEHFKQVYDNLPYTYFSYKSDNLVMVKMFGQDTHLQIMVITRDAFNKDINIIHNLHDKMGDKPIEIIQKTNPILILDEPQKMGGEATQWGIEQLNPLFILRYSATHKDIYNLVYKLTPYDAYNLGLVKKIEVLSITEEGEPSSKKIILEKIESMTSGLKAKIKVFVKEKEGIKFKTITIKHGENLVNKTDNFYYNGFVVSEINKSGGFITFSNGVKIYEGKSSIDEDEIIRFMVRETVREHLDKKKQLNPKGIKVLSLFFLNRVDDYLLEDGIVRKMFEEEFNKLIQNGYGEELKSEKLKVKSEGLNLNRDFSDIDVKKIHSGYFSKMKKEKSIEEDESAYDLIMKDKEKLLSLEEPVEFIFSHSALREGWDNPNVFNICTLAYSTSEIKKRQEIGRGLRLPVDQNGNRIQDRDINLLTVVTNESYREYLEKLQTEYREEIGEEAPPVEERKQRVKIKRKDDVIQGDLFKNLWDRVSPKAKFIVNIDSDKFIEQVLKEIQKIEVREPEVSIKKVRVETIKPEDIKEEFIKEASEKTKITRLFNLISYIEKETNLTKRTIFNILTQSNNLALLFLNPQEYAEKVIQVIKECKKLFEVEGIEYIDLEERFDVALLREEVTSYDKYVFKVQKSIYDGIIKESNIEEEFAKALDNDSRIKLFVKLPDWYLIETPAGNYTPDWAIVVERVKDGVTSEEKIYFVVETKGTNNIYELKTEEQIKIKSAVKRFKLIRDAKFVAPVNDFDSFEREW